MLSQIDYNLYLEDGSTPPLGRLSVETKQRVSSVDPGDAKRSGPTVDSVEADMDDGHEMIDADADEVKVSSAVTGDEMIEQGKIGYILYFGPPTDQKVCRPSSHDDINVLKTNDRDVAYKFIDQALDNAKSVESAKLSILIRSTDWPNVEKKMMMNQHEGFGTHALAAYFVITELYLRGHESEIAAIKYNSRLLAPESPAFLDVCSYLRRKIPNFSLTRHESNIIKQVDRTLYRGLHPLGPRSHWIGGLPLTVPFPPPRQDVKDEKGSISSSKIGKDDQSSGSGSKIDKLHPIDAYLVQKGSHPDTSVSMNRHASPPITILKINRFSFE